MGDHLKVIRKDQETVDGEKISLSEEKGHFLVQMTLNPESINLEGFSEKKVLEKTYLVKVSRLDFVGELVTFWQVAEGCVAPLLDENFFWCYGAQEEKDLRRRLFANLAKAAIKKPEQKEWIFLSTCLENEDWVKELAPKND